MQEVVEDLLKAEAAAQEKITRSREEAKASQAQAESEYTLKLNQAREEARRFIMAEVEKTRDAVKRENDKILDEARAQADGLWQNNRQSIGRLTDEVAALILTPEYEKD